MGTRLLVLALSCLTLVCATPRGRAQDAEPPLRQLTSADDAREWQAVGRLDLGGSGFCTGVLISDVHVLTAAHCMYSRATGRAYEPGRVVFRAGLRNGRAIATRRARRFVVHSDYDFADEDKIRRVASDLAIVELELPIRDGAVIPFQPGAGLADGEPVTVVSYAAGRDDAPALQEGCLQLGMRDGVLVYSCDVTFGASGSPVFVRSATGPRIASVMSAMAQWHDRPVSLAAAVDFPLDGLIAQLAAMDPVARTVNAPSGQDHAPIAAQLGRDLGAASPGLPQIGR